MNSICIFGPRNKEKLYNVYKVGNLTFLAVPLIKKRRKRGRKVIYFNPLNFGTFERIKFG